MFAARADWDLTLSPHAARAAALRAEGRTLYDLTNANPASLPLPGALLAEALAGVAREPQTRAYAPDPRGDLAAREAIAAYHRGQGARIGAEQIVLTAGTSEGYAHLFRVLADPGDTVHLPTPGYPLFEHLAELEGLRTARYRLVTPRAGEARWPLDLDGLASTLSARSRALVAIHPHNPTGSLVAPADLASLRAVCAERELALLSDEVFADSAPAPTSALACAEPEALTCVLSGASKVLGVAQLKVAWIAVDGPPRLREAALAKLEFAADAYLSVSPLVARMLPALFARRDEIRAAIGARVAANRAALCEALRAAPNACVLPAEAGWAAIVRVAGDRADEALALAALEVDVLIHPGSLFELGGDESCTHLVASLLAPEEEFAAGARALAATLARAGAR
ncbi:MAG: pyridoxal phosphate-dependent aminotransferase [Deltaproteobacteria bacterium]|nr:pyridoxal phosphate-dependent aminotransferase [Deltaproteobacteria bacterium]